MVDKWGIKKGFLAFHWKIINKERNGVTQHMGCGQIWRFVKKMLPF